MTDFLGFEDDNEKRAAVGPAVIAAAKIGGHELRVRAAMHVDGAREEFAGKIHMWQTRDKMKHYNAGRVIFTSTCDPKTGEPIPEQWDEVRDEEKGTFESEGERWRKIMRWPVGTVPTPADAMAFMANANARLLAKWWGRLQEARALDERIARGEGEAG
jgi:hypothetical protein